MEQTNTFSRLLSLSILCFILFFFTSSLGLITTTTASSSFPLTNETDRQALLAIKDLIPGDPFLIFRSWNHSTHFCRWYGITCSPRHQRVTVLNLSSRLLEGSLSPYIGNLTFLRAIDLGNNTFHGTIPQEIGKLLRLRQLTLWNNSFQGELPTNLSHCSNIQVINLIGNNLVGEIPTELGSLSSLLQLGLAANHFTGSIPTSFGNLSQLAKLSMADNNLQGNIPSELGQHSNLQFLQLASNNLRGVVPNQLYNISFLTFFSVTSNQLLGSLPPDLGLTLPNLQGFYVAHNQFHGPIPSSLANASRLVKIDMANNSFRGPIPMNLGSLHDLQYLIADKNSLGTNESNELNNILTPVSNCSNLQYLALSANSFSGMFPYSVANLSTSLNYLILHENYIYGRIPPGIGNLVNLLELALADNMLTGSIPDSIGKLSNLVQLYMYTNQISGEIPSSIGNLTKLSILSLYENKLERRIPVSLGNCTSLSALSLSYNHVTGLIPEQIFGLSSLSICLYLDHNRLTGPVPLQVGALRNLGQLDLSENELSGEIPETLGNFQVLESLVIAGNHFEGTIPASFKEFKGIQVMDLSSNNLSGQIPTFFEEFTSVRILNLSYNRFEGEVSSEGLFKNITVFSVVGNNKLCGGVKELQLPTCHAEVLQKKKGHFNYRVIIPLVITSFIVVLLVCLAILFRIRTSRNQTSSTSPLQNKYPKLSYAEILQATNGFSSANLIGEGRYGIVFKGILNFSEQIVAVKVLNLLQRGGNKSFITECEALKSIRHRNLVKIITSCSSIDYKGNDFKALVFEFMKYGSLESWLYPRCPNPEQQDPKNLNLTERLNIAIDVASALDYLHHQCEEAIIHCDVKPSNVLLDDDLCAHVSDFGLARILSATAIGVSNNHHHSSSNGIRGTIGYVAPEYGMGKEVSTQGDMYSYGVLLLEMFIGKRPTDNMFIDSINLSSYAKMSLPNQVMEIIDPRIISNTANLEVCLVSVLQIGVSCSAEQPNERMNARDVLMEIHKIRNVLIGVAGQVHQDGRSVLN